MAKFNGTLQKMYVKGTPNKLIQNTRDISLTINIADIDVSDRESDGWLELLPGQRSWNGKATGVTNYVKNGTNESIAELIQYGIDREMVELEWSTNRTSDKSFSGEAMFSNVQWSAAHEGQSTWTADVKGSGPITMAAIV